MRRTSIRKIGNTEIAAAFQENRKLLFLTFTFIAGLCIGVIVVRGADGSLLKMISDTFSSYVSHRTGQSFFKTLFFSITSVFPFFAAAFIAGLCVVGTPFVPLVSCFRGLGIGLTSGFLYATYGLKGIAFSALLIMPPALISSIALLLACRESMCFSLVLARAAAPRSGPVALHNDFKIYCLRFIFILGMILASSLLDSVMSLSFMRFFTF